MDNHWFEWLVGGYVTLLTWLGKRATDRIDDHDIRIRAIETNHVSRRDIDELRQSLMASIVNVCERLEVQNRDMHNENREAMRESRETMARIHERVDGIWERRSRSRAD